MQQIQQAAANSHPRVYHSLALMLLALSGVIVYWPVSSAELLYWDTQTYVNDNVAIHEISAASLWWMLTQTYHANWHPLTWLSHALDIQLFGFSASGHHWMNLAWHVGCGWLLYLYTLRLLPRLLPDRFAPNTSELHLVGLLASLLFVVHPQHVESVAWVAERKDLLCAFFYLLCLYCYDRYVTLQTPVRCALMLCCAAAAIMSKPMAMSLPAVLLIMDLLLYQRLSIRFWRDSGWLRVLLEKIPIGVLVLACIYLTLQGQFTSGAVSGIDTISLAQRLTTSVINWAEYLASTVIPVGLSPYYPFEPVIHWPRFLLCLAGLIGLLSIAEIYRRRGHRWIMLALMYYSVTLLPVIGIVQIGTIRAADRYTYLPTIPLYLLAAVLIILALKPKPENRQSIRRLLARLPALMVIPLLLGFSTHHYSKVWQSDVTLWEFVRHKQPQNIYAAIYLAEAYYRKQRYRDALPLYQRAYLNRELISPRRRINIFINRYFDTAYRLGLYQDAESAIFNAMREQRLWFMPRAEIYYNAALINFEQDRFETALQLLDMAWDHGLDLEKLRLLRQRIEHSMQAGR